MSDQAITAPCWSWTTIAIRGRWCAWRSPQTDIASPPRRTAATRSMHLRSTADTCIIVLDLTLPEMDGQRFRAAQLRDRSLAWIPVVVLSGSVDGAARARELGARAFVPKPVDLDRLQAPRSAGSAAARRGPAATARRYGRACARLRARHRMLAQRMAGGLCLGRRRSRRGFWSSRTIRRRVIFTWASLPLTVSTRTRRTTVSRPSRKRSKPDRIWCSPTSPFPDSMGSSSVAACAPTREPQRARARRHRLRRSALSGSRHRGGGR